MTFAVNFLNDPVNLAVVMAGLALVIASVAVLHYSLERKSLLDRVRRLEATLALTRQPQEANPKTADEVQRSVTNGEEADESERKSVDEYAPDSLPPGVRFV